MVGLTAYRYVSNFEHSATHIIKTAKICVSLAGTCGASSHTVMQVCGQRLGMDPDKIILLSTPFPTIPMLGTNCCCTVLFCSMLEINDDVLYCVALRCVALY